VVQPGSCALARSNQNDVTESKAIVHNGKEFPDVHHLPAQDIVNISDRHLGLPPGKFLNSSRIFSLVISFTELMGIPMTLLVV
jgi:hypothetical protein